MASKLLLLKGGNSSEREISLRTGGSVESALSRLGVPYVSHDVASISDVMSLPLARYKGVFLALHGGFGEDGSVQALLENIPLPFNGACAASSMMCMDKYATKLIAADLGIAVPRAIRVCRREQPPTYENAVALLGSTLIVKPNSDGCSVGVSLVTSDVDYDAALATIQTINDHVLIEEHVDGTEITVGFFNGKVLKPLAVNYVQDIFSWEAKFQSAGTTSFEEAVLPDDVLKDVIGSTEALSRYFEIDDYFRVDYIIRNGKPILLEINTLPGLNEHSVFPIACSISGTSYDAMLQTLIARWD